ncbi:MAG: hypothetical protein R3C10_12835 [Pirellulales bacterium]
MSNPTDLERIIDRGIVAVVRAPSGELLVDVAEALLAGGVDVLEITFTVPRAERVVEPRCRPTRRPNLAWCGHGARHGNGSFGILCRPATSSRRR